jgi:hypothetical protein
MKIIDKAEKIFNRFIVRATNMPSLLVLYVIAAIAILFISWFLIYFGMELVFYLHNDHVPDIYILPAIILFILSLIVPVSLLFVTGVVLYRYIGPPAKKLGKILQVIIFTVITYAIIYYYLVLFIEEGALSSIAITHHNFRGFWEKVAFVPDLKTIVDCIYFSITTFSTIGFGDIHPTHWISKIIVATEMVAGFLVTVVSIGYLLSGNQLETNRDRE